MKQTLALFLFALAALLPVHAQMMTPAASTPANQPIDRIVAVVNDEVILQSELNDALNSVQQQYAGHTDQLPPMNVLKQQVLNRLILMHLQTQKAQEQGIRVSDAEVDQAVQGVAKQNKMTADQLRAEVERSGASFGAFRQQLADQMFVQRLHQNVVQDSVSISDSEINNLLASPTYKTGEVHLAHIQISIPSGADAAAIQAAQTKAEQATAAIKGGMDFNAAAIRFSDASDALEGGDLGWRKIDEIPASFADTVSSMKIGDVSPALRGATGFHILKLVDQRENSKKVVTEFHARQILIKPSELVTLAQAEQKASDLYNRIVTKHEDFATLAKEDSKDDTTANVGGDMGWFAQDAWGTQIAQELGQLKDNEVSKPFQTQAGWHIIQRMGTRQSDLTDKLAREEARQAIGTRKSEQVYDDFLRDLRSNAYIEIVVPELRPTDDQAAPDSSP
jgi:peptidyl-prolyl cis-trans isomerase SurA